VRPLADYIHRNASDLRATLRDLLETQKASEHDDEIDSLTGDPQTFLRRLNRWHDFKSKSSIQAKVKKAAAIGSAGEQIYLTYDEKKPLKIIWRMRRRMTESRGWRFATCPPRTLSFPTSMPETQPLESTSRVDEARCGSGN
jgi:hypothetical protein